MGRYDIKNILLYANSFLYNTRNVGGYVSKAVNIRISGIQRDISDEPTIIECTGSFHSDSKLHYIRYTDSDGIKNLIKIKPGHAIVSRSGALSSVMEFIEGSRSECVYPTPYGHFDTIIETEYVRIADSEVLSGMPLANSSGNNDVVSPFAQIKYNLSMNGQKISGCELNIYLSDLS